MANHSFNTKIAQIYGVNEAIIIENMYLWIKKNEKIKIHLYDGHYWIHNSVKAFSKLFPYWSQRQIETVLKNLEKKGAVKTGNYNKTSYDRTKWYTITKNVMCIYDRRTT